MCNQATSRCQACLFSVILPVLLASFYSGINLTRQVKEKLVHRMEFDCVTHHFLFQRDGNDEWGSDGEASPAASPSGQTWWNRGSRPGDKTSLSVNISLNLCTQYLDSSKSECLNEADDHPYQHCLTRSSLRIKFCILAFVHMYLLCPKCTESNNTYCCSYILSQFSGGGHLASDCDEQLIISLSFNQVCSVVGSFKTYSLDQVVKVQSLKIKAPANCGPKTIR